MAISHCGHHGLHVPMLVEELHYGHVNVTAPTQHLQMAGKTARDRAFNLNFARSKRVEVSRIPDIFAGMASFRKLKVRRNDHVYFLMKTVDGRYSPWSAWSSCSQKCGQGMKKRRRHCNNPEPANGGRRCRGARKQVKPCYGRHCQSM